MNKLYNMIISFLFLIMTTMATSTREAAIYNVHYSVDDSLKTITVNRVNNETANIIIAPPNGQLKAMSGRNLDLLHHFPGVATDIIFPSLEENDLVHVLMSNGALMRIPLTHVVANFHSYNNRMVYGQLRAFTLTDYSIAENIYAGAPVFKNKQLVSVITCRHDDFDAGVILFPVTGVRSKGLISGNVNFDDKIVVRQLAHGMSVYGNTQLPYASISPENIKKFAVQINQNRLDYRNLPRNVAVFHDNNTISISLVEGAFEIDRIRLDGPLITAVKQNNLQSFP